MLRLHMQRRQHTHTQTDTQVVHRQTHTYIYIYICTHLQPYTHTLVILHTYIAKRAAECKRDRETYTRRQLACHRESVIVGDRVCIYIYIYIYMSVCVCMHEGMCVGVGVGRPQIR